MCIQTTWIFTSTAVGAVRTQDCRLWHDRGLPRVLIAPVHIPVHGWQLVSELRSYNAASPQLGRRLSRLWLIGTKFLTYRRLWRHASGSCQLCTLASDVLSTTLLRSARNVSGATSRHDEKTTHTHTHTHTHTLSRIRSFFPLSLVRIVLAVFVEYNFWFGAPLLLLISQLHSDTARSDHSVNT